MAAMLIAIERVRPAGDRRRWSALSGHIAASYLLVEAGLGRRDGSVPAHRQTGRQVASGNSHRLIAGQLGLLLVVVGSLRGRAVVVVEDEHRSGQSKVVAFRADRSAIEGCRWSAGGQCRSAIAIFACRSNDPMCSV